MNPGFFSRYFNPIYTAIAGVLGGGLAVVIYTWNYPAINDQNGQAFIHATPYLITLFLIVLTYSLATIFLFPAFGIFYSLFKTHRKILGKTAADRNLVKVILSGFFLAIVVILLIGETRSIDLQREIVKIFPQGFGQRANILAGYSLLVALPIAFSMVLIHVIVLESVIKIPIADRNKTQQFALIKGLQNYRAILQSTLVMIGIVLSMIPLVLAGIRTTLIAINPQIEQIYPVSFVIIFGLLFTIILLFIYIPAHLSLTEAGKVVRDYLYPIKSLATLKHTMEKRKLLDELLQTNMNLTDNLKAGIVTLSPFISSLVVSLLGISI